MTGGDQNTQDNNAGLDWTAAEFADHDKGMGWYWALGLVTAILAAVSYFATSRDWFAPVSITLVLLAFGAFATKKPKEENYRVDASGLQVGPRLYPYSDFKGFSVVNDGDRDSLFLVQNKRVAAPLSIHFPHEMGQQIIDTVGQYLPYSDADLSTVDKMMHRFRF